MIGAESWDTRTVLGVNLWVNLERRFQPTLIQADDVAQMRVLRTCRNICEAVRDGRDLDDVLRNVS